MDVNWQDNMRHMAAMGLTLFRGLKEDGASDQEAQAILSAIYSGMFLAGMASAEITDTD